IAVSLIALLAGVSYPSVSAGLDSLRLHSTSDQIAAFIMASLERADRRQEAVEVWISPQDNALASRSAEPGSLRRLDLPRTIRIAAPDTPRRFLFYPGGAPPRMLLELSTPQGHRRLVSVDPLTGSARSEVVP